MTGVAETNMKRGWIVVAICFVAMALTFGARSSVSMVLPFWQSELGWTAAESSAGASIVLLIMALGSPVAGNIMDRYGARRVIAAGLIALAAGIGGTSYISESLYYYLFFGVVGGIGWASVSIPMVTATVSGYFVRYRGLAIGVAVSGATGGQLPVLSLFGAMIAALGWRDSYQIMAVLLAGFAVLVYLRFKPPLANPDDPGQATARTLDDTLADRLKLLFANRTFLLLLAAFSLCGFTTAGVIDVYFIPYAISCGFTLVEGSAAYGVHGLGNLAGVILFSWMADHVNRPRLLAGIFFFRAFTFVLLMFKSTDISVMLAFAEIFGILNFGTITLISNIVATHIGVRIIGLTLGLLFGGHSMGAAIGVVSGGWMFDLTSRYEWVWWISAGLAAMAGVCAILIRENRPPRGESAIPAAA